MQHRLLRRTFLCRRCKDKKKQHNTVQDTTIHKSTFKNIDHRYCERFFFSFFLQRNVYKVYKVCWMKYFRYSDRRVFTVLTMDLGWVDIRIDKYLLSENISINVIYLILFAIFYLFWQTHEYIRTGDKLLEKQ